MTVLFGFVVYLGEEVEHVGGFFLEGGYFEEEVAQGDGYFGQGGVGEGELYVDALGVLLPLVVFAWFDFYELL